MRKTLMFRCKNDFSLAFSYKELLVSEYPVELLDMHLGYWLISQRLVVLTWSSSLPM